MSLLHRLLSCLLALALLPGVSVQAHGTGGGVHAAHAGPAPATPPAMPMARPMTDCHDAGSTRDAPAGDTGHAAPAGDPADCCGDDAGSDCAGGCACLQATFAVPAGIAWRPGHASAAPPRLPAMPGRAGPVDAPPVRPPIA